MPTPDEATVKGLEGVSMPIRGLLSLWGYRIRDHASVPQIRLDLTNAGLSTVPDFAAGSLDHEVAIVPIVHERATVADADDGDEATEEDPADDSAEAVGVFPQAAMRVHDLPCAHRVASITPDEPGSTG
ncbi:hypothetical protein [Streptomyces sp. NPDC090026]|uniref:hypothetical protein n=1 Tax=Streptomyces sp. NPDC090026 TaxID=3365923 RepID=UPI0037FFC137